MRGRGRGSGPWLTAAAALVGAAFALGLFWAPAPASGRALPAPAEGQDVEALYLRDCAVCHGADGRGTNRGPTLVGVGRASIDYYLSTGRMPLVAAGRLTQPGTPVAPLPDRQLGDPEQTPRRRRPAYSAEVVRRLVDYTAELAGGTGPDIPRVHPRGADVAQGGEMFRLQCAACHAWAGDGGALLGREAPRLQPATSTQVAEAVRVGPGQMPAFGTAALSARQLDEVVAYVRYLDDPRDRGGNPLWHLGPVAEGAIGWVLGLGALLAAIRWIGERG